MIDFFLFLCYNKVSKVIRDRNQPMQKKTDKKKYTHVAPHTRATAKEKK